MTKDSAVQGYWFERLIAFAIDAVVISVAFGILAGILVIPSLISSVISGNALDFGVIFGTGLYSFLNSVILVAYFALAESLYGTTLGKSVMGLKVVSVDGRPLTLGQTFIRDVSKINWVLLLLDVIFGLATQQDYKQKYSDKYARTMVVKRSYVFA